MEWVVVTRKEERREVVGKQEEVRCGVVSDSFFNLLRRIIFNKYLYLCSQHSRQQRESLSKHFVSTYLLLTRW